LKPAQIEWRCPVLEYRPLNDQFFVLTLAGAVISRTARPGQFVNLSCDQFLRRPFGILSVDCEQGQFSVGIRIQGKGTEYLASLRPGDEISVLGPLGHGYDLKGYQRIITVGGGTGVFPLYFVHQACRELGIEGLAVAGFRSAAESILIHDFDQIACQTLYASDAGDLAVAGNAADALDQLLATLPAHPDTAILTCGPMVMMKAVAAIAARHGLPCQVSLEERMGCGIGICLVCVCKIKAEASPAADSAGFNHERCCVEGPVFAAEEVLW
jgi:dihydroorotate dehydrogenase electron transfer subunit